MIHGVDIDITCLLRPNLAGIGVYTRELINALNNYSQIPITARWRLERYNQKKWIPSHLPSSIICKANIRYLSKLFIPKTQIFHGTDCRLYEKSKNKKIITVHDMGIFEEKYMSPHFAKSMQSKFLQTLNIYKPDAVICVSEFTKTQFLQRFPDFLNKTFVTELGASHINSQGEAHNPFIQRKINNSPFILYIGCIEHRKNIIKIIEAFELLAPQYKDINLILAGAPGFGASEIIARYSTSPYKNRIHFLGFISNAEQRFLYKNALAFVFPSLYEGFGIPILEAMAMQCPVVTSDRSSLPEVAGKAALLAPPESEEAIAKQIQKILDSNTIKENLIAEGIKQVQKFSWKQCAQKTLLAYSYLGYIDAKNTNQ